MSLAGMHFAVVKATWAVHRAHSHGDLALCTMPSCVAGRAVFQEFHDEGRLRAALVTLRAGQARCRQTVAARALVHEALGRCCETALVRLAIAMRLGSEEEADAKLKQNEMDRAANAARAHESRRLRLVG